MKNIYDMHVHTHFAYCSKDDMLASESIKKIESTLIDGIVFTEHSTQLYINNDDFWSARFVEEPHLLRGKEFNRMKEYKEYMKKYRSDNVKIGLETDLDINGSITVLDEDRSGWDILLGSIHWLPKKYDNDPKSGFLWAIEAFGKNHVDIIAHPFRNLSRKYKDNFEELYKPLIEILKEYNLAVEINLHYNNPDPKFFEMCLKNGVKISLGSDAHILEEVGNLEKHIELLESIYSGDLNDILFKIKG